MVFYKAIQPSLNCVFETRKGKEEMAKKKAKPVKAPKQAFTIIPKEIDSNIQQTLGVTDQMLASQATSAINSSKTQTWEDLAEVGHAIAEFIATTAGSIHESVELVKSVGCDHVQEFNATVVKTNEDFQKFLSDYEKVKAKHAGKSGPITDPSDIALCLRIFEDYQQLYAFFNGVMHHTQIAMTEYALEAKNRLVKQMKEEEEKAQAEQEQQTQESQEPTTTQETPNE